MEPGSELTLYKFPGLRFLGKTRVVSYEVRPQLHRCCKSRSCTTCLTHAMDPSEDGRLTHTQPNCI